MIDMFWFLLMFFVDISFVKNIQFMLWVFEVKKILNVYILKYFFFKYYKYC